MPVMEVGGGGGPVMDIYDGADWTEMDVEDPRSAIEHGRSIEQAAEFLCRTGRSRILKQLTRYWRQKATNWRTITNALLTCLAMPSALRACWASSEQIAPRRDLSGSNVPAALAKHFYIFKVFNEQHVRDDAYRAADC
jgi:hypothetical protein